jgi:hypothetical protein
MRATGTSGRAPRQVPPTPLRSAVRRRRRSSRKGRRGHPDAREQATAGGGRRRLPCRARARRLWQEAADRADDGGGAAAAALLQEVQGGLRRQGMPRGAPQLHVHPQDPDGGRCVPLAALRATTRSNRILTCRRARSLLQAGLSPPWPPRDRPRSHSPCSPRGW